MRRALAAAALAAALAACQAQPGGPVVASGSLSVQGDPAGAAPLRLSDLRRMRIDSRFSGAPGTHDLRVDVFDPGGTLYAQLRSSFDAPDGSGGASHRLEVRGTPIESYHLTGSWTFVLYVDGTKLASTSAAVAD